MTKLQLRAALAALTLTLTLASPASSACPADPGFNGDEDNATDSFGY